MFSYYLQGRSYYYASKDEVIFHLQQLNSIILRANANDHFYRSVDFHNFPYDKYNNVGQLFESQVLPRQVRERVLPMIDRRVKIIKQSFMSITDMDKVYNKTKNAFFGAWFYHKDIRLICSCTEFLEFRRLMVRQIISNKNFKACCGVRLQDVIVTEEAFQNVPSIGKVAKQVFFQLIMLDEYVSEMWKDGAFNEADVSSKTSLTITDESDTVKQMPHLRQFRYFRIPSIGSQYCYLHIKLGGYRIHIYPDNVNHKIFVPYIGKHLPL